MAILTRLHFVSATFVVALLAVRVYAAAVPTAIDSFNGLRDEMHRARTAEDWNAYLAAAQRQLQMLNGSPPSHLEVARAEVHLNSQEAALRQLHQFVDMGQASELLDTLPELASLRDKPDFKAIQKEVVRNRKPVATASLAFALIDPSLLPEDIDYDPGTHRFLISSVLKKKVVQATLRGELDDFAGSPDGWPVLALKIDPARQLVWATEVALDGFEGVKASDYGRSALLCYSLSSGQLVRRVEGPRPSALGDMTLTPDGTVIVSDGEHGGIYRVSGAQLERLDAGDFISPQTVTLTKDGTHLIVPDYVRGLALLATDTKRVTWLSGQNRYALNGIDGLYRMGDRLIAVQNGVEPERVVTFSMDQSNTRIIAETIVERSTRTLGDPTHGVIVGKLFYYIANSGWNILDDSGHVKPGLQLSQAFVMRVELHD